MLDYPDRHTVGPGSKAKNKLAPFGFRGAPFTGLLSASKMASADATLGRRSVNAPLSVLLN